MSPDLAAARERAEKYFHCPCAPCLKKRAQLALEILAAQRDEAQRGVTRLTRYRVAELNAAIEEAKRS